MNEPQDELDRYLRQFRPRSPGRRPAPIVARRRVARWLPAAAAIVIVGIGAYRVLPEFGAPGRTDDSRVELAVPSISDPTSPATLGWLTQAALASPDALDAALAEASRTTLPDVAHQDSTLNVLARH